MANNKYYGYNPQKEETLPNKVVMAIKNEINRIRMCTISRIYTR